MQIVCTMRILIEVILDKRRPKASGLYAVKVRVTYLRQQRYYYVGLDLSQDEFDNVMALKVKLANKDKRIAIDNRLAEIRNAIDALSNFSFGQLDVALKSAKLTLDSTNLGFKAGLRDSIDVLRAQQVYFDAEKDILDNKYDYLMNLINLKFSVGMLTKQDIIEINKYLIMEQ